MKRSVVRQWNITVTGYDFWIIQCVVLYSVRDIACPRHFHLTEGEDKKYPQNKQQQPEMDERKNRMWMRACATRFLCNYRIISSQGFIFFFMRKSISVNVASLRRFLTQERIASLVSIFKPTCAVLCHVEMHLGWITSSASQRAQQKWLLPNFIDM